MVEFSKTAQNSEYHLITYNMQIKPAIFLNYTKDYADLILDDKLEDLQKAIENHSKSMIIIKKKNMVNSENVTYLKNFKLVKSCKKYELYQTID